MDNGHWSDCALYNAPAFEPGPCDCGGLDLAAYDRYVAVASLIPTPGSLAEFVQHGILPRSVKAEESPVRGIAASASSADLPSAHDGVSVFGDPRRVDLNDASEAPVGDSEPLPSAKGLTRDVPPHNQPPESLEGSDDTGGAS